MSHSPHVMGQADAALSRVIAETSATPSASQYWERKRPLFRQLAIRVVEAMHEGLSKEPAVARSILELRIEVLQRAATDSARQAYREWFDRRGVFLSGVAKRLWEGATMANFPQQSIQHTGSYKAEMKVNGGWSSNARRYATREEADAAGQDLYSRWTSVEEYRVVPSSDPPNVEPVKPVAQVEAPPAKVKPAEEKPGSDSRILFMHVGDAPKPAQAPKAKVALDYTPQSGAGTSQESLGELLAQFHSQSRILNNRFWVNRGVTGGYPEKLAEHVEDLGQRIVALAPAAAPAIKAIEDAVEAVVESRDGESHWELAVEELFRELFRLAKPPVEKPQAAVTEQRVLRYSLHINGLWGKKRTPDFQSVTLASRVDPKEPWPLEKLLTVMRNKVAELRVKPGAKLKLLETDVTLTPDGFERITLLTDRTLHTETLS